jgi:hypothetical protein
VEFCGVLWSFVEFCGVLWSFVECVHIPWNRHKMDALQSLLPLRVLVIILSTSTNIFQLNIGHCIEIINGFPFNLHLSQPIIFLFLWVIFWVLILRYVGE